MEESVAISRKVQRHGVEFWLRGKNGESSLEVRPVEDAGFHGQVAVSDVDGKARFDVWRQTTNVDSGTYTNFHDALDIMLDIMVQLRNEWVQAQCTRDLNLMAMAKMLCGVGVQE